MVRCRFAMIANGVRRVSGTNGRHGQGSFDGPRDFAAEEPIVSETADHGLYLPLPPLELSTAPAAASLPKESYHCLYTIATD